MQQNQEPEYIQRANMPYDVALKKLTAKAHEEVEKVAILKHVFSNQFDLKSYGMLLSGFLVLESEIQNHLDNSRVDLGISSEFIKVDTCREIKCDLKSLKDLIGGFSTPEIPSAHFETNPGFSLGLLYLREGSRMGGMTLCKIFQNKLGFQDSILHYFNHNQSERISRWNSFKFELCESLENNPTWFNQTVEGALKGFDYTKEIFETFDGKI